MLSLREGGEGVMMTSSTPITTVLLLLLSTNCTHFQLTNSAANEAANGAESEEVAVHEEVVTNGHREWGITTEDADGLYIRILQRMDVTIDTQNRGHCEHHQISLIPPRVHKNKQNDRHPKEVRARLNL